jgi:hypothetical protein
VGAHPLSRPLPLSPAPAAEPGPCRRARPAPLNPAPAAEPGPCRAETGPALSEAHFITDAPSAPRQRHCPPYHSTENFAKKRLFGLISGKSSKFSVEWDEAGVVTESGDEAGLLALVAPGLVAHGFVVRGRVV